MLRLSTIAGGLLALPALVLLAAAPASAIGRALPPTGAPPAAGTVPQELAEVSIEERSGAEVPKDVLLRDPQGREVAFGSYLGDGRPVVLVLAYYQCPMLCTLVLNGLTDGLRSLGWTVGENFRVVTVSIDPRDSAELAAEKQAAYLAEYGRAVPPRGWDFLTGDEASVRRLADAVGFRYRWDEATGQYAHAAGAFVITPEGRLSRTLYGLSFPERELRLSLVEASEGKLGGAWGKVLMFCFNYDPHARSYALAAIRLMKAGGALTALLLGGFLLWLSRRYRRPEDDAAPGFPHSGRRATEAGGLS